MMLVLQNINIIILWYCWINFKVSKICSASVGKNLYFISTNNNLHIVTRTYVHKFKVKQIWIILFNFYNFKNSCVLLRLLCRIMMIWASFLDLKYIKGSSIKCLFCYPVQLNWNLIYYFVPFWFNCIFSFYYNSTKCPSCYIIDFNFSKV